MKKALRTYTRDFIAIIVLAVIGIATLLVILSQQTVVLPNWLPGLGEERFEISAEFQTSQAVTPGQGQTVTLSGVKIGEVEKVELEDGVAVVTMGVENQFSQLLHPDTSALLRPRTGLQDMTIDLDAGTEEGEIPEGFRIPLASTEPNVNVDQILASLDGDTRAYLRLLLAGGAQALGTPAKSQEFANVLRRLLPTVRDIAKINGAVAKRRDNLRRVITNFKLIAEELAKSDTNLTGFVTSQARVFGAFAESQDDLRATLRELPGALQATRGALASSATLSAELKPALTELIPQAKALGPALRATRPFFRKTTPSIRDQIRPFTRNVDGTVSDLRRASQPLLDSSIQTSGALTELNALVDPIAFNPSGSAEGYLFYLSWLNHNTNSSMLNQDGMGPVIRALAMYTCNTSRLADNLLSDPTRPVPRTARDLVRLPTTEQICPPLGPRESGSDSVEGAAEPDESGTTTDETTTDESTTDSTSTTTTDSTTSTDTTGGGETRSTDPTTTEEAAP